MRTTNVMLNIHGDGEQELEIRATASSLVLILGEAAREGIADRVIFVGLIAHRLVHVGYAPAWDQFAYELFVDEDSAWLHELRKNRSSLVSAGHLEGCRQFAVSFDGFGLLEVVCERADVVKDGKVLRTV